MAISRQAANEFIETLSVAFCQHCGEYTLWVGRALVWPSPEPAPPPNPDLPEDVRDDYLEARAVAARSPRSAAALLRLSIQKITTNLKPDAKDLNGAIAALVADGLPVSIQQALDVVRVVGNNAVHPGEIDLKDDYATASALFSLVNLIGQTMYTQPAEIQRMYAGLPTGARDAIKKRDAPRR